MTASRFAALLGLAAVCFSGFVLADVVSVIGIKNTEAHAVTVEYRIGNKTDCEKNTEYSGKQTIGAKQKWTVKIKDERVCCLRLFGSVKWIKNDLRGGKDYEFTVR